MAQSEKRTSIADAERMATAEAVLAELVQAASAALGSDLRSALLFGSAAEGRLRANSDVNVLILLKYLDAQRIDALREPLRLAHGSSMSAARAAKADPADDGGNSTDAAHTVFARTAVNAAMQKTLSWYRGDKKIAHGSARPGADGNVGFSLACAKFPVTDVSSGSFSPRFMLGTTSICYAKRLTSRGIALQSPESIAIVALQSNKVYPPPCRTAFLNHFRRGG